MSSLILLYISQRISIYAGKIRRFVTGDFTSVAVHQDQVYAAESQKRHTQVFQYNNKPQPKLRQLRSINHDFGRGSCTLTLSISNDKLRCCSAGSRSIKVYSLSGQLLQTHNTSGYGYVCDLSCPVISDDDDDGSVLITDHDHNDNLYVMSEQGAFNVLHLQPTMSRPNSAVLLNGYLFVTATSNRYLYKYSC